LPRGTNTGSTSTGRSQLALLQLTKILSSYYYSNCNHYTLVSLQRFAPPF
jgi:hypothetical protein